MLCLLFSLGLNAQIDNSNDAFSINSEHAKEKSKEQSFRKHGIGLSITSLGPLELNYEYRLNEKFSLRAGLAPLSFDFENPSFEFNAGFRYQLFTKGKFEFFTGLDYSYLKLYREGFGRDPVTNVLFPYDYKGHRIEIPLGVKYHLGERSTFTFSASSRINLKDSLNGTHIKRNKSFLPFTRFRLGYQYQF